MQTRKYAIIPGLLILGMVIVSGVQAQPLDDRVRVDMPYTTIVGQKTLPPGEYIIQQLPTRSGSRVLLFYSDHGTKFETSAVTTAIVDPTAADNTSVVLTRVGDEYYYDRLWIQGKTYSYQFVLPREARERRDELMAKVRVPGATDSVIISRVVPPPAPVEQPTIVVEAPPAPAPEPPQVAVTPPAPTPPPEAPPAPPAPEMPKAASGWLAMMIGGGALLAAGMTLRRRA